MDLRLVVIAAFVAALTAFVCWQHWSPADRYSTAIFGALGFGFAVLILMAEVVG
jgi:hypothetical protein